MIRNMCGRSLGSRPRALVRSLGSRPNVHACGGADGADLRARGGRPAGGLQSVRSRQRIGAKRLPAVGPALFDDHHEAVVGQRVSLGFVSRKRRAAVALSSTNTGTLRPSGNVRVSSRY